MIVVDSAAKRHKKQKNSVNTPIAAEKQQDTRNDLKLRLTIA